jgi:predicted transcriptional regulator
MSENTSLTRKEIIELSAQLASAYLKANATPLNEVHSVMHHFFHLVSDLNRSSVIVSGRLPSAPSVPIENSVHEDYIICLEDGKRLQMLKRHLSTVYKMTVDEYKERWGLDADYPVVAPNYAKRRSQIAKTTGLGRSGRRRKLKIIEGRSGAAIVA